MTENYGPIYSDNFEPERADTRQWFVDNFNANRIVCWNGEAWRIERIQSILADPRHGTDKFVVEGANAA